MKALVEDDAPITEGNKVFSPAELILRTLKKTSLPSFVVEETMEAEKRTLGTRFS